MRLGSASQKIHKHARDYVLVRFIPKNRPNFKKENLPLFESTVPGIRSIPTKRVFIQMSFTQLLSKKPTKVSVSINISKKNGCLC